MPPCQFQEQDVGREIEKNLIQSQVTTDVRTKTKQISQKVKNFHNLEPWFGPTSFEEVIPPSHQVVDTHLASN